jgi:outer membrane protein TolC
LARGNKPTTGPAIGIEPLVRLSLQEILHRTVVNSLSIKVAGYQPAIDETRVTEAEARFDPVFFTTVQYSDSTVLSPTPENSTINPGNPITFKSLSAQTGVRQDLESGGRVEVKYETARTRRFPDTASIGGISSDPFYTSNLTAQTTQPLLRDFGADVNRARITIARGNQRISLLEFRKNIEETISKIEQAYWQLLQAERDVRTQEELLNGTLRTADVIFKRRQQDTTRVQISQANASVETRRAQLIRARARVRDFSDQIKRLMNDPDLPVAGATLILPGDQPVQELIRFNPEDQINTAMENRLELGQQQIRIENATVAARVAQKNLLPQLNAIGSIGAEGIGSNWYGAVDSQDDLDFVSYSVGLQLEIPIGNREARSIWRRAQLQHSQAIVSYSDIISQVSLDVKTALRNVETTWDEMVATRLSVFAQRDALDAIQQREDKNEQLTPTFVQLKLDTQERLAANEQAANAAVANYNIAIAQLEQAKGTLLRYNNILMEEENAQLSQR